jgi:hypothetical protein
MTITPKFLESLRAELAPLFKQVGDKHGVQITLGRGSYNPANATFKLEVAAMSTDGVVQSKESEDFKQMARLYGLQPEDLNQPFYGGRGEYVLVGLNTKARTMPLLGEQVEMGRRTGKRYKFTPDAVKFGLERYRAAHAGPAGPAKPPEPKGMTPERMEKFKDLANRLSPENLFADGERSRSAAARIRTQLMREWKTLEALVGRKVTEDEVLEESIKGV